MFRFVWLLITVLMFVSCDVTDATTKEVKEFYISKGISFPKELKTCLILPEVGCGGCIDGGVYFLNENKEYYKKKQNLNMFILTSIKSPKMMLRTLNEVSLEQYNCMLDSTDAYLMKGNNSIYPLVLYLNNGEVVKAQYQSPYSGDIFVELEKTIKR